MSDILNEMLTEVPADYDPRPAIERNWKEFTSIEYGAPRPAILNLPRHEAVIELSKHKLERSFGNSDGQAHVIDGKLFVRETPAGHREIEQQLAAFRQLRARLQMRNRQTRSDHAK